MDTEYVHTVYLSWASVEIKGKTNEKLFQGGIITTLKQQQPLNFRLRTVYSRNTLLDVCNGLIFRRHLIIPWNVSAAST